MQNCILFCPLSLEGVPGDLASMLDDAFVVGVDGGMTNVRKAKLDPSLWVGDGDSLKGKLPKKNPKYPVVKLKKDKNYSDLEYALHLAGQAFLQGAWDGDVILLGAQGGRIDQEIGNLLVVQRWLQDLAATVGPANCPNVYSYGVYGIWFATIDFVEFYADRGQLFSVFTFDRETKVSVQGAKYTVRAASFDHGSRGLSNVGMGRGVRVSLSWQKKSRKHVATPAFVVFPANS